VIRDFACRETKKIFEGIRSSVFPPDIQKTARRKLKWIDAASSLGDLKAPYGNHLEALKKERKGQHSIRINDKWRICFVWKEGDASKVEIDDYH
jgi:proteic killer suppression protein